VGGSIVVGCGMKSGGRIRLRGQRETGKQMGSFSGFMTTRK